MRKVTLLVLVTLFFLANCSQKVGVKLDPDYKPEVRVVANQDYPEIKVSEIVESVTIADKNYPIIQKDGREIAKLPRKYLKHAEKYNFRSGTLDHWKFNYLENNKVLEMEPKSYKVPVTLLRQNPRDYDKFRPFIRDDLANIEVYFNDKKLPDSRYISEQGRPDLLEIKIPTLPQVHMDDYRISINIPGYENYQEKLIDIQDKTVKLKLQKSMLRLNFVNLDQTMFEPGFVHIENQYGLEEKYSSMELKQGISFYDIEFPINIYSKKGSISIFDKQGNMIDTLVVESPGYFDLMFKERMREFPAILYDISQGQVTPEIFEKWVNEKKESSEGIFLYVTNGYEKIFNSNPDNIIAVSNKIYRLVPRTSNVLESIGQFTQSFKQFASNANLNDEEIYGTKLAPRYYIFLSDDNVERLEFAVNKLVDKIEELGINNNNLVIFINESKDQSTLIQQLKNNNITVQLI